MQIRKTYVNDKLVALGDCTITTKFEKPKYTIKCFYDTDNIDIKGIYLNNNLYKFYTNIPKHLDGCNIDDIITGQHKNIYSLVKHLNRTDKANKYFVVYAIIHSGVVLSLNDFHDPWDSGIGGILQINKENCNKDIPVEEIAKNWIDNLNAILMGNVICYRVYDELNYIVDCWGGFINTDINTTIKCIYDSIPQEYGITKEDIAISMDKIS